jgi:glycosyltransferase involved in cell wall biosynthesis
MMVEGAYPYLRGGVSSWVNDIITKMPEHEFVIQTIGAFTADAGKFLCSIPDNVTEVSEAFLDGGDTDSKKGRKRLNKKEFEAVRSLLFGDDDKWEEIFEMFQMHPITLHNLLMGPDFFKAAREYYDANYNRVAFSDFLWTCRSMYLPIFTVLKCKFPEADVYHAVATGYSGVIATCAGYLYNKPVILTEHGIYTREREEEIIRAKWTKGIYKDLWIDHFYRLSNCIYNRADRIYSLFKRARETQIELGCLEEDTEVIHNGIRYEGLQGIPVKDEDDNYINIGAVVRVVPIKDVKTMISAFHHARETVDNIRLYIMGGTNEDEEYYQECLELIEMLGTEGIIFTGHINVKDHIGKMDVIILTSISEGQPLSLLEGMAAGKACISTRVGDCFDMLYADDQDKRAGIVVPVMSVGKLAEAMVTLAVDDNLREKMGENGRAIVLESYQDTMMIDKYRKAYDQAYSCVKKAKARDS